MCNCWENCAPKEPVHISLLLRVIESVCIFVWNSCAFRHLMNPPHSLYANVLDGSHCRGVRVDECSTHLSLSLSTWNDNHQRGFSKNLMRPLSKQIHLSWMHPSIRSLSDMNFHWGYFLIVGKIFMCRIASRCSCYGKNFFITKCVFWYLKLDLEDWRPQISKLNLLLKWSLQVNSSNFPTFKVSR